MEIKKVYKTSKGIFWDFTVAAKKSNRKVIHGSHPGEDELEPVEEVFVLTTEVSGQIFLLNQVEIKGTEF